MEAGFQGSLWLCAVELYLVREDYIDIYLGLGRALFWDYVDEIFQMNYQVFHLSDRKGGEHQASTYGQRFDL